MTGEVMSYCEDEEVARPLASEAAGVARSLGVRSLAIALDRAEDSIGPVLLLEHEDGTPIAGSAERTAGAIAAAAVSLKPSAILIGLTSMGREISARLAVKLRVGCLTAVRGPRIEGALLVGERSVYAGNLSAKLSAALPCVALVQPGDRSEEISSGTTEVMKLERIELGVTVTSSVPKPPAGLQGASVVVAAGRGVRAAEDLSVVEALANALGGVMACTRPLSSDLGWLGSNRCVGLTGLTVHPQLYVAVGVSGQMQHVAGIRGSKVIVAINTDRSAPIFREADYGIVGDLYEVVPALLKALKA